VGQNPKDRLSSHCQLRRDAGVDLGDTFPGLCRHLPESRESSQAGVTLSSPEPMIPWNDRIGSRSRPVANAVERGAVRRFAEAIGDANPLYLDEEAAARTRWGRLIAPPTFPRVFDFGTIEGLALPASGVIHGEQSYRYSRPLFVGEEVVCHSLLTDVYQKRGREGTLTFVVLERVGEDSRGERIFSTEEIYILTESVMARARP
jgi:acyl dehydratase